MRALGPVAYIDVGDRIVATPVVNGTASELPNSARFHLIGDGYAYRQEQRLGSGNTDSVIVWNLRDNSRIETFFPRALESVSCTPTWCRGTDPASDALVAVRLSTGDEVAVDQYGGPDRPVDGGAGFFWGMSPELPFQTLYVWDLTTGRVGTAGNLSGRYDYWPEPGPQAVVTWRTADGDVGALDLTDAS
jgi:hypothetical protein